MIYGFDDDKHKVEVMSHSGDVIQLTRDSVTMSANQTLLFEFTTSDARSIYTGEYMIDVCMVSRNQASKFYTPVKLISANANYPSRTVSVSVKNDRESDITGNLIITFIRTSH